MLHVVLSFLFFRIRRVFIAFVPLKDGRSSRLYIIHSMNLGCCCGKAYGTLFSHDVPTRVAMPLLLGDSIGMVISCSV